MVDAQITKAGLDFLSDDGGLPAMLGKFRIRFYKDELVEAIEVSLKKSSMDEGIRELVVARLDALEPELFKEVVERFLLESVMENHERLASLVDK